MLTYVSSMPFVDGKKGLSGKVVGWFFTGSFSPVIVTDEPPDVVPFLPPTAFTTGPSNVNCLVASAS